MTAIVLDGKGLAKTLRAEIDGEVARFKQVYGIVPSIAIVRAGEDRRR